ncbi:MAG: alpha/beta hydrolase [Actinobacteria bacterium]|jgi:pimeloyl-ACP methyl ester carboxylesterase|nr:alpha/beta hydrolase [Actinomycetota bacterium]
MTATPHPELPRKTADLLADLPAPWPRRDVVLSNGTFSLREARPASPDAAPALFVHGLGGAATNWTDLMALLRDRLDGVAPDLPGFGWSPPPRDGDYTPRRSAESMAELIETRFDGRPVHLFGNSMGGSIAVQLAARRPELVRSLTLISPALPKVGVRRTNVHLPVVSIPGVGQRLVKRYLEVDAHHRVKASVDINFADPSTVPEQRMHEAVEEIRRRDALPYVGDAFVQSLRGLMATYLDRTPERPWKLAERITVPTLLVYGRRDKLVDPIHAHTKAFPDVRVLVIPHAGHVAQIEQPVLVADAWRSLLPG